MPTLRVIHQIPIKGRMVEGETLAHIWVEHDGETRRICDDSLWPHGLPESDADLLHSCPDCLGVYAEDIAHGDARFKWQFEIDDRD